MLTISRAALLAASLSLATPIAIGLTPVLAQDSSSSEEAAVTPAVPDLGFKMEVPTIVAVGSSMDESAIRDALAGNFLDHVDELAGLNATSITIPEIITTMNATVEGTRETTATTYKNIVLTNVKDGVAESLTMDGSESVAAGTTFAYGKLTYKNVDIGSMLKLIGLVPADSTDFATLYSEYSIDGMTITGPEVKCTLGGWSGLSAEAKPVTVLLKDVIAAGEELQKSPEAPPAGAMKTVVTYITDLITAFRTSPATINGLDCTATADGKNVAFGFGNITVGQFEPGIYPSIALTNFKVDAGAEGMVSIDKLELKQIDFNPPVAVVRADIDNLSPAWFDANARRLIPSFAGFDLSGVKFDIPNPEAPGSRIKASLGDFDLTMSDYLNGLPTRVSSKASALDIPLPDDTTDPQMQMLKSLGINRLNLNYELGAGWDKASNTLTIDKVSVSGNDLGSVAISAVIGNATEQLFDVSPDVQQAASMGVTLKSVTLDVGDAGLADLLVPLAAGGQGADPATFRQQIAATAEGAAIAMLGSSDAGRAVGKALSDFVIGAQKNLTVTVTSKDPAGLPIPVLMQSQNDPSVLQSAVDVTATAK